MNLKKEIAEARMEFFDGLIGKLSDWSINDEREEMYILDLIAIAEQLSDIEYDIAHSKN